MMARLRAIAAAVTAFEIVPVGLLIAFGVVSPRALWVAPVVAALFWPIRWLAHRRVTARSAADLSLTLLLLTIPVTLWATALPEVTLAHVLQLLAGLALYSSIINWTSRGGTRLRWLATGLIAVGLGLALVAPVTVEWTVTGKVRLIPDAFYHALPLLLADPIHPNIIAGALGPLLPLALALPLFAWRQLRWRERALTLIAAPAMLAVLALTKSRGGWLGFAAAGLALAALRWRRGWLAAPIAALIAGGMVWLLGAQRIVAALTATQTLGGMDGRLEVWSRGIYMLQDFPFTGIGIGTFKQVANAMYPFFLAGPDADIPHAHNLFLQVGIDLGLPGLIAWLSIWLLVIRAAWAIYRAGDAAGAWWRGLGAGLLASQVALGLHGLLDASVWGVRPAVIVWAIWGLALAAGNLQSPTPRLDARANSR